MKKLIWALSMATCMAWAPAYAQSASDQELTMDVIKAEKKLLVSMNLGLSEEEKPDFWPIYEDYQKELTKIDDRTVGVIEDYANNFFNLTDEKAKQLLDEFLAIEDDFNKLRHTYIDKFSKVIPPKKVVRYFQIEKKLDAVLEFELARRVPLVR